MFIMTCKYCGNKFETKRYPTVFCSQSCYFKYKRAKANENRLKLIEAYDKSLGAFLKDGHIYFKKKCAHCGNEFYHCCPEKFYHKVGCSTEPASGTLAGVVG